jgi:hypothetical protein
MSFESEAFFDVCRDAKPAYGVYVSLYAIVPYYGGPEEGGWWGSDTVLVASQSYPSEEGADAALERVNALVEKLDKEETHSHGGYCAAQLEWCENHGVDDSNSVFGEDDGPTRFWAVVEKTQGEHAHNGCRHYE